MRDFRIFWMQFQMGLRIYARVPAALFWLIAFPVVMLLALGLATANSDDLVGLVWAHGAALSAGEERFRGTLADRGVRVELVDPDQAEARWRGGRMPALLEGAEGPSGLRVNSYFTGQAQQIDALVQQAYLAEQALAAGQPVPARVPVTRSSPGGHRNAPYAAYLLPGLLGLNLMMLGVFNVGMIDVTLREKGGYKRLATTPLSRHVYLAAQVATRFIIALVAATTLLAVGAAVFGVFNQGSYAALLLLLLLGGACFISLGYVLGSLARSTETYGGLANLVFLPLMLLSGVYFSLDSAPAWLQQLSDALPLAPLITALRAIFNDGASLASQEGLIARVAVWSVLLFLLATRRFRWV